MIEFLHSCLRKTQGAAYYSQGDLTQGATQFQKGPSNPARLDALWESRKPLFLDAGQKARAREAYLRGIQLIREELRSKPDDVTLRSRLALYLAKRGDRGEALTELARLETTAGKDARARFRMLVAYEAIGSRDKALAALGQALRGGFPSEEIRMDPEILGLRADPRYHELIAALGAS